MPFKKGNTHATGRPKGSKNKTSLAEIYKKVLTDSIKDLNNNFDNYTMDERINQLEKINRLEADLKAKSN